MSRNTTKQRQIEDKRADEFTLKFSGGSRRRMRRANLSSATVSQHMLDKAAFVHANVGFRTAIKSLENNVIGLIMWLWRDPW